jgi:hypothetical protein
MKTVELTREEITVENISFRTQIKIFMYAMIMIPITAIGQIYLALKMIIMIPSQVIDIVTMAEKTKLALKRKQDANL